MAGTQSQMAQAQSQIQSQKSSQSQKSKVKINIKSNPFGRAGIKCEMESTQKSNPGSKSQIKLISPPSAEAGTGNRGPPTVIRGWVAQKSAVGPQSVKSALILSDSEKYNGIKWQCSYSHYISQVVPEPPGNQ
jgi:hypothetical protein